AEKMRVVSGRVEISNPENRSIRRKANHKRKYTGGGGTDMPVVSSNIHSISSDREDEISDLQAYI
ncbi:hypothetical protein, partial [Pseudomonas aeruginosa]|uniref:hypothetical protein n=1 Tax=Pseudomonas aeruginosa TaxID=287 RepID=UPI002B413F40